MQKKQTFPGGALLSPVPPTLVSCGNGETKNIFTVAWTGTMCTKPPVTYISVRQSRFSYDLIEKSGEFVINLVPENLVSVCDSCGVKSGRDLDKFETYSLTAAAAKTLKNAPIIEECPVNIECKVIQKIPLGSHDVFMANITAVNVNSDLIDENGKIRKIYSELYATSYISEHYTL